MMEVKVNESLEMLLVAHMHKKFGIGYDGEPRRLSDEERAFRVACLREEIDEYEKSETTLEEYDALLDMAVFLIGTLYRQGIPFRKGFEAVMSKNLEKELGANKGKSRGEFSIDLRKPEGWVGPEEDLKKILSTLGNGRHDHG